jgi:folate-binding protein YgfZ
MPVILPLTRRGILSITGDDRKSFLQGLISNDTSRLDGGNALYASLLTAQGKYLHDFFLVERDGAIFLDGEADRLDDLKRRLGLYRLRAKVAIENVTAGYEVLVCFGEGAEAAFGLPNKAGRQVIRDDAIAYVDPRLAALGVRIMAPKQEAVRLTGTYPGANFDDYERLRISLGVPDGKTDLVLEKSILLENGFDELNGIDWKKGCYIGQELTARTKYRGLIKKRLMPVAITGPVPAPGSLIKLDEDEVGEMRGAVADIGLAMLRLDSLERVAAGAALKSGDTLLRPIKPDWAKF